MSSERLLLMADVSTALMGTFFKLFENCSSGLPVYSGLVICIIVGVHITVMCGCYELMMMMIMCNVD